MHTRFLHILLQVLLTLLLPLQLFAYSGWISGRVTDARSREPIPGANIMIQGTVLAQQRCGGPFQHQLVGGRQL